MWWKILDLDSDRKWNPKRIRIAVRWTHLNRDQRWTGNKTNANPMNPPLLTGTSASSSDQSDSLSSYFFFFFFRFRTGCDTATAEPLLLPAWLGIVIACVDVFLPTPPLCFFKLPLPLAVALAAAADASLSAAANRLEPRPCWTRSPRRFCSASMVRKVVMNSS